MKTLPNFRGKVLSARTAFLYFLHAESGMRKTKKEGGFDRRCKSQKSEDSSNDVCEPV